MSDVAISVANVSKRFRIPLDRSSTLKYRVLHPRSTSRHHDFFALKDIDFDVPSGQFLGIIGHNGCGKSTLLKLMARIYQPTSGHLEVNGLVSPFLELGVGFNPELTARENVFLNGAILGLSHRELQDRMEEIIHFAELENFVDQKVKNFSSGMQVRLAFSVAIRADASVLLMDEVLAVGDARFQAKCFEVFSRYKREGKTVILVTHDLSSVEKYCDRTILIDRGEMIADGLSRDVSNTYKRMVGEQVEADVAAAALESIAEMEADPTGKRWGSGEITIEEVKIRDELGQERSTFSTGEPLVLEVNLDGHTKVDDVVCGFLVHQADGTIVGGTNTQWDDHPLKVPAPGGRLSLRYRIPALAMREGSYRVSVSAHPRINAQRVYNHHEQVYQFSIRNVTAGVGLLDFGGSWATFVAPKPKPKPDKTDRHA